MRGVEVVALPTRSSPLMGWIAILANTATTKVTTATHTWRTEAAHLQSDIAYVKTARSDRCGEAFVACGNPHSARRDACVVFPWSWIIPILETATVKETTHEDVYSCCTTGTHHRPSCERSSGQLLGISAASLRHHMEKIIPRMKTFLLAALLAVTAVSGVVVASQSAAASSPHGGDNRHGR